MRYTVLLESRVERQLRAIPKDVLRRIDALIERLAENPRPRGTIKLSGRESQGWRIRVGDYRVLYTIDDDERIVEIYRIAPRGRAYR